MVSVRAFLEKRRDRAYTLEEIADRIRPVAEAYGVGKIYVFGSCAKGRAGPEIDVDLLVSPCAVKGIRIGGLYRDLADALGKSVDIVTDRGDPEFIRMISKDLVLIFEA